VEPNVSPLAARRAELVATLEAIRDPQARLSWVVERARSQPRLPPDRFQEVDLVPGCRVRIWWRARLENGRCRFESDSDAVTLKAMAALISDLCDGASPEELAQADLDFLERLGMLRQLAESRQATVLRIVELARGFGLQHSGRLS
jgi:cysteine desulfuration protein SufE